MPLGLTCLQSAYISSQRIPKLIMRMPSLQEKTSHDNLSPSDNAVSHIATVTSLDLNNTHISTQLSHRHTHILSVHIYIQVSTHTSHNPKNPTISSLLTWIYKHTNTHCMPESVQQQCHIGSLRKANEDLQLWSRWQRERQILLRTVNAAQHSRGSRSAHRTTEVC